MTRLLLVRHGATEFNHSMRFTGHSQIGLSDVGRRQVAQLAGRLAGEDIDVSLTSDLRRAVDTANAACDGREIEPADCPELREIDYGGCEGLTFDEIRVKYPEVVEPWLAYNPDLVFPAGESLAGFIARVGGFVERLAANPQWKTVLVVTHGGVIRVLICHLLGMESGHWWRFRIDNASVSIIETYGERAILSLSNDTCHLAGVDEDG
jgi:broad specificity phosphatase PhoE